MGKMADMENNLWKIQEYGTTWKGKGLYHVTLTIPDRQRILGNLIIPMSFPKISRQFFDYIPTLVDIYSRYVDIFLS